MGCFAHDLELAFGNHIDQIAHRALLEQHLTGFQVHSLRRPARRRDSRYQVDDAVGQRQHPAVVGRNHHHPFALSQRADQSQHLLYLDEVKMGGRLVGEDQGRIQSDRASNGDALLLPAAEVTGAMFQTIRKTYLRQQFLGALAGSRA